MLVCILIQNMYTMPQLNYILEFLTNSNSALETEARSGQATQLLNVFIRQMVLLAQLRFESLILWRYY